MNSKYLVDVIVPLIDEEDGGGNPLHEIKLV